MPVVNLRQKVLAALAAIAVLGAVLGAGWVYSLRAENKRLGEANTALAADLALERDLRLVDQQVAQDYRKRLDTLITKRKADEAKLSRAVAASPEWATAAVPDAVADALGLRDSPD